MLMGIKSAVSTGKARFPHTLGVTMTDTMHAQVQDYADRNGLTRSAVGRLAFTAFFSASSHELKVSASPETSDLQQSAA